MSANKHLLERKPWVKLSHNFVVTVQEFPNSKKVNFFSGLLAQHGVWHLNFEDLWNISQEVPNSKTNKYPKKIGFFCDLFEFSGLQPLATTKGKDRQLQSEKIPRFTFLSFVIVFEKSMIFDFFCVFAGERFKSFWISREIQQIVRSEGVLLRTLRMSSQER